MGVIDIQDDSSVLIRFDKDGIWIDGKNIKKGDFYPEDDRPVDTYLNEFMDHFKTGIHSNLQIGSTQGNSRSWAYYEYISYHKVLN